MQAAEAVSLDCSFANTQGKGHRTTPSHCVEELRCCSSFLGVYSLDSSAFVNTPLKTLKMCRFFIICVSVRAG